MDYRGGIAATQAKIHARRAWTIAAGRFTTNYHVLASTPAAKARTRNPVSSRNRVSIPSPEESLVPRAIMAFNGDLEARLALHWLVHERGYEVITLSINLGQETYLEPLGEIALELGAT